MLFGRTTRNRPSRFIGEIPNELLKTEDETERFGSYQAERSAFGGRSSYGGNYSGNYNGSYGGYGARQGSGQAPRQTAGSIPPAPRPRPAAPATAPFSFKTGDRVYHKTLGEGSILKIEPMGGDHLLTIHFDSVGAKRLMATFARLEKR